jgi:small subunit ribosomal protein S17
MSEQQLRRRMTGRVISDKAAKTLVVLVTYSIKHPIGKYIKRHRKIHAHDEASMAKMGDVVVLEECRPISKKKSWRLVSVVDQAIAGEAS